jgi:hypothetical protein
VNLFLFGDVKRNLLEYHAESPFELLAGAHIRVVEIQGKQMAEVFLEWIHPLRKWIDINREDGGDGKYDPSITTNLI